MIDRPEKTVPSLLSRFSRFAASCDTSEEDYVILSRFALFVVDGIDSQQFTRNEIDNIFDFMNELGESRVPEVQNQLVVGILEILTDSNRAIEVAREELRGEALDLFERVLAGWPQTWPPTAGAQ